MMSCRTLGAFALLAVVACGRPSGAQAPTPVATGSQPSSSLPAATADAAAAPAPRPVEPAVPPALALLAGLMPLHSTGVVAFRTAHPSYDGRGVLIGILDSGVDPGVPGLIATSTAAPKILDLRDFSGEGRIALRAVKPDTGGTVVVDGRRLRGAARIGRLAVRQTWYAGMFRELSLGTMPAADVNGNGTNTDQFPVVVVRAIDGWVVFFDSNLNGTFEDEMPLHDYRQGRETIALGSQPVTLAANFSDGGDVPVLDLYFDTSGHGTHVAGIAAGYAMFNVAGFDGVAPGAQLLGLKIANDARGGISVTGSMQRAMEYAAQFAATRNLPLVLNLSFGVGNELEGRADIDSIVDAFLTAHPDVVLVISAGNDGPGLSTMGFPGSANLALTVGALEPGAFTRVPQPGPPPPDRMGWWSSRGGELAKPDLVAPGMAFSTVPRWNLGDEIKSGTSMAAPQLAGLVACLRSAMVQEGRAVTAADIMQALRATATPLRGWSVVDQGAGVPSLDSAYRWLLAGHQGSRYTVRTEAGASAALWREGFPAAGDSSELFTIRHVDGLRAAQFALTSDVPWATSLATVTAQPRSTTIQIGYRPALLMKPGVYVGTVTGRNPTDSLAGPLFTLTTSVIVPSELGARPVKDGGRVLVPAQVQRYFLRVPVGGASLRATLVLGDHDQDVLAQLYDPTGRPVSGNADSLVQVGFGKTATAVLEVPAEDLQAGVYELDVWNPGTTRATVSVTVELAPVTLSPRPDGSLEATNIGVTTANLVAGARIVGAERAVTVTGRGEPAESIAVVVPAWAVRAELRLRMPREQWERFTDFGLTVYDSAGQQLDATPMNYAVGRATFDVPPAQAGHPAVIELFPALARRDDAQPWTAELRIRFFRATPDSLGPTRSVDVVAGGRTIVSAVTPLPTPETLPDGFALLVGWRLAPARGAGAAAVEFAAVRRP
jgi:tripeptidyl-peptidase-2